MPLYTEKTINLDNGDQIKLRCNGGDRSIDIEVITAATIAADSRVIVTSSDGKTQQILDDMAIVKADALEP